MDYKKAGVDIEKANRLVESFKDILKKNPRRKELLGGIGGFGAFFDISGTRCKAPVLVSSCDGVGTKLKIAFSCGIHDTVGIDLVAMSVNDVLCSGAKPLFFLDYIATGRIAPKVLEDVVRGIARGCEQAGCMLVGGETAEMPGMYPPGEYDLAGFCVGVVDRHRILGEARVRPGDAVLGLASSGLHSNGYSLVRRVIPAAELKKRGHEFLVPTRIYVRPVLALINKFNVNGFPIRALAHITGGAFYDKAARAVPEKMTMVIRKESWRSGPVFEEIQERGRIETGQMYRTFNMGIGFMMVVRREKAAEIQKQARRLGLKSHLMGEIVSGGTGAVEIV